MDKNKLPQWNPYLEPEAVAFPDQIERPPLTGKRRNVAQGLYDQPWDKVSDAYGKAGLTPYYIEALTSDDENDVKFGTYGLYSATTHQGSVYKASQMAVPFLAELLALDENTASLACHFLARIALGENHFISTPAEFYKTKYYGTVKKHKEQIAACFARTNCLEALRLLCFIPKALPDQLDCSFETSLRLENGNVGRTYLRQASTLLVQGFVAAERNYPEKGYPTYAADLNPDALPISAHTAETHRLMEESPSLLVRGCAAICLAYTGLVNREILELLAHLAEEKCDGLAWVWDEDFSAICKKAWLYGADIDALISTDRLQTLEYTSRGADGVEIPHYSQSEVLLEAACRVFPLKYSKDRQSQPSLLPSQLTETQKRVLQRMLAAAPNLFTSYETTGLNLPRTAEGAQRLLKESSEVLCTETKDIPLWFLLEQAVQENQPEAALPILRQVDAWAVLDELYRTWGLAKVTERCTLSMKHYDPKIQLEWNCRLQSLMADALKDGYEKQIRSFLDEWLERSKDYSGNDWSGRTKAQRIGICLLALARAGRLDETCKPLVRPFHSHPQYSEFPTALLREVLACTPTDHQNAICKQFGIAL